MSANPKEGCDFGTRAGKRLLDQNREPKVDSEFVDRSTSKGGVPGISCGAGVDNRNGSASHQTNDFGEGR